MILDRLDRADLRRLEPGDYDPDRDHLPLLSDGDLVTHVPGRFALLFPHDAQVPGIAAGQPAPVHKVVVKIAAV